MTILNIRKEEVEQDLGGTVAGTAKLGSDGTIGGPSGSPLSPIIVTGVVKDHGNASGTVAAPDMSVAHIHIYTATGNLIVPKPVNFATGVTYGEIVVVQDGVGGHNVSIEGITWPEVAPVLLTGSSQVNIVKFVTYNGGTVVYGIQSQGKAGGLGEAIRDFSVPGELQVGFGSSEMYFPKSQTLLGITPTLGTAAAGQAVILEFFLNGEAIYASGARPTVNPTVHVGAEATTFLSGKASVSAGSVLEIRIAQVGTTTHGSDLAAAVRFQ